MTLFDIKIYDLEGILGGIDFEKLQYAIQEFLDLSKKGDKLIVEFENLGED